MRNFLKIGSGFLETGKMGRLKEDQKFVRRSVDKLPTSSVLSYKIRLNISTGNLDISGMIQDFRLIAETWSYIEAQKYLIQIKHIISDLSCRL